MCSSREAFDCAVKVSIASHFKVQFLCLLRSSVAGETLQGGHVSDPYTRRLTWNDLLQVTIMITTASTVDIGFQALHAPLQLGADCKSKHDIACWSRSILRGFRSLE